MNINKILAIFIINLSMIHVAHTATTPKITCDLVKNPHYREKILNKINEIRSHPQICGQMQLAASKGLKWSNILSKSADIQAKDNAKQQRVNHINLQGHNLKTRMLEVGYHGNAGGENLASGQSNMDEALMSWLKLSPSHCSTLMDERYTEYAISCATNAQTKRTYWVQHFGRKNPEF